MYNKLGIDEADGHEVNECIVVYKRFIQQNILI